jgi:DNA damage-binding protein 1
MPQCLIRAPLPDNNGKMVERFILGTSIVTDADFDGSPVRGRILVLGVDSERSPYLVASKNLYGGCFCLSTMGKKIIAGMTKSLVVYNYVENLDSGPGLEKLASQRLPTAPIALDVSGDIIGVSDMVKSLILFRLDMKKHMWEDRLREVAGHYYSVWATSVCHIEDESWLQSDANGNLIVLRQKLAAPTVDDQRYLDVTSEMNLGEMVNQIRPLEAKSDENSIVTPRAFLGTVGGHSRIPAFRFQDHSDAL